MIKTLEWTALCGCTLHLQYDSATGSFDTAVPIDGDFEHRLHHHDGSVTKTLKKAHKKQCASHASISDLPTLFQTLQAEYRSAANTAVGS